MNVCGKVLMEQHLFQFQFQFQFGRLTDTIIKYSGILTFWLHLWWGLSQQWRFSCFAYLPRAFNTMDEMWVNVRQNFKLKWPLLFLFEYDFQLKVPFSLPNTFHGKSSSTRIWNLVFFLGKSAHVCSKCMYTWMVKLFTNFHSNWIWSTQKLSTIEASIIPSVNPIRFTMCSNE